MDGHAWWQPWFALGLAPLIPGIVFLLPGEADWRYFAGAALAVTGIIIALTGWRAGNPAQRMCALLAVIFLAGVTLGLLAFVIEIPLGEGIEVKSAAF